MAYLEFDDSLKLGNKLMDQEHVVLIDYINLLQKAVEEGTSVIMVIQVLDGLKEYAKTHFFLEEELMRAYDYPAAEQHKAVHENFKYRLSELFFSYENGEATISDDTLTFLKDWLTEHFLEVDKELADFLAEKSFR